MCNKPLLDNLTYCHSRVERGIWVLEDYLQILAEQAHLGIFQSGEVYAVIQHCFVFRKFGVARVLFLERVYLCADFGYFILILCNCPFYSGSFFAECRYLCGDFCFLFRVFFCFENLNFVLYVDNAFLELNYLMLSF